GRSAQRAHEETPRGRPAAAAWIVSRPPSSPGRVQFSRTSPSWRRSSRARCRWWRRADRQRARKVWASARGAVVVHQTVVLQHVPELGPLLLPLLGSVGIFHPTGSVAPAHIAPIADAPHVLINAVDGTKAPTARTAGPAAVLEHVAHVNAGRAV